jgi:hypothetical protein
MDTILLTVDAVLGVLGSALSLSVEIVRARWRAPAQRPDCPQGRAQVPDQDEAPHGCGTPIRANRSDVLSELRQWTSCMQ